MWIQPNNFTLVLIDNKLLLIYYLACNASLVINDTRYTQRMTQVTTILYYGYDLELFAGDKLWFKTLMKMYILLGSKKSRVWNCILYMSRKC